MKCEVMVAECDVCGCVIQDEAEPAKAAFYRSSPRYVFIELHFCTRHANAMEAIFEHPKDLGDE